MTDQAERRTLIPRGTFEPEDAQGRERDRSAPLQSYVSELGARFDSVAEDEASLTIPPNAVVKPWVAANIGDALQAAAETVPRTPSSPDSPFAPVVPSLIPPSPIPGAELAPRHVRRPRVDAVERFPVELDADPTPTLRSRERGRKSGRFVSPGKRMVVEADSSIADAVAQMIAATPLPLAASSVVGASPAAPSPEALAAEVSLPVAVEAKPVAYVASAVVAPGSAIGDSALTVVARAASMFVLAVIAGATTVYFLLRG